MFFIIFNVFLYSLFLDVPGGSEGKASAYNAETWVPSLGREDAPEKEMATTPALSPGESHGWRSLVGYSPWGRKELDTTEQLHFNFSFTILRTLNYKNTQSHP